MDKKWKKTTRKILDFFNHGTLRFVVLFGVLLLALYGIYFLFVFKAAPSVSTTKAAFTQDPRIIAFRVLLVFVYLCFIGFSIFLYVKKIASTKILFLAIFASSASMIISYGLTTPIFDYGGIWNQHDLYYSYSVLGENLNDYGSGHFGIIMTIFKTGKIPEIPKDSSGNYAFDDFLALGERYQPKLFYLVSAGFMKFNSLFIRGTNAQTTDWATFESLKILYTYMEVIQLFFIYRILQKLSLKRKPLMVSYLLVAFTPVWCYFANWANNDGMSWFFSILALYFLLGFMQKGDWLSIIGLAISIGLSMSCKMSGALIAIVAAPFLIYKGIMMIKNKEVLKIGLEALVFIVIVFPLGLMWPIYSYVKFGQPIFFFAECPNPKLDIVNTNFFDRFIWWPNADTFRLVWVYHSNADAPQYIQDTSLITALIKTSLYGEYGFGDSFVQMTALYILANIVFASFLLGSCYLIFKAIQKRSFLNLKESLVVIALIVVMYGWCVIFVQNNPQTCNEDIRYAPMLVIGVAAVIGYVEKTLETEGRVYKPVATGFSWALLAQNACFGIMALIAYLTICPYYVR